MKALKDCPVIPKFTTPRSSGVNTKRESLGNCLPIDLMILRV